MKLKITIFAIALMLFNMSFAQKVKIKDNFALVDGAPYIQWEKVSSIESSLRGLNSTEEEIFASWLNYSDPARVTSANPEGKVRWVELYFPTLELRCEVRSCSRKELVKTLMRNNIYVDGLLSKENTLKLVKKYGMRFSESKPNSNIKVIINN